MAFVSTDEFAQKILEQKEARKVLTWSELEQNKIFKVVEVKSYDSTKFKGRCHKITLEDAEGIPTKVWGSQKLVNELLTKAPNQIPFLTSLGQEPYKAGQTINAYDLYLKEGDEVYKIFNETYPIPATIQVQ